MTPVADAAAFAAHTAIEAGEWDDHLDALAAAVRRRKALYDDRKSPTTPLPAGQVWVWINGNPSRWEPRGTGALLDA